jgi:hypothetical protein
MEVDSLSVVGGSWKVWFEFISNNSWLNSSAL